MFYTQIMPNIDAYQLLSHEMRVYFSPENMFMDFEDENFVESLEHNEPKGGSKDFEICKPPEKSEEGEVAEARKVTVEDVKKSFQAPRTYKGNFGWDTDSDEDDNCIAILSGSPQYEDEDNEGDLMKAFSAMLRTKADADAGTKELTPQEVRLRLGDPDVAVTKESFVEIPVGLKRFLELVPFFKDNFGPPPAVVQHDENNLESGSMEIPHASGFDADVNSALSKQSTSMASEGGGTQISPSSSIISLSSSRREGDSTEVNYTSGSNSMHIPHVSANSLNTGSGGNSMQVHDTSLSALSDVSNQAVINRSLRASTMMQAEPKGDENVRSSPQSAPSRRKPRSRKEQLVKEPATNLQMDTFVKKMAAAASKRRRDSLSPETK